MSRIMNNRVRLSQRCAIFIGTTDDTPKTDRIKILVLILCINDADRKCLWNNTLIYERVILFYNLHIKCRLFNIILARLLVILSKRIKLNKFCY